jgi:hypothetical protein
MARQQVVDCTTGAVELVEVDESTLPPLMPAQWSPLAIIDACDRMGVAQQMLANTDEVNKARFLAAQAIPEDDPRLIAALQGVGKTIADLKAALVGGS